MAALVPPTSDAGTPHDGVRFLQTLFAETDTVLFRPIESWIEGDKKKSRVDHPNICYRKASEASLTFTVKALLGSSAHERTNIFFGVCPRLDGEGRFDLAWQIRTVRALWTDIDHISVDAALERVSKSGLPPASIVVHTGNGVHLYWLLNAPYLIDDVDLPPPVRTEWLSPPGGRKKPRKYVELNGERAYLDLEKHLSRLSPKAQGIQNVLTGIARQCGGDHTTDLTRLLRVPGTFNRKDERHGRNPILSTLVACDATRKYSFQTFETFASPSPECERERQIASMPLPKVRKLSAAKIDQLAECIAACGVAAPGTRSEADFRLCCFALRKGVDKEQLWSDCEGVGKFAESGRRYFDRTWAAAEFQVRMQTYETLTRSNTPSHALNDAESNSCGSEPPDWGGEAACGEYPVIRIEPATTRVGETLREITNVLKSVPGCHTRCAQLVVVRDTAIDSVLSPAELAGLLNEHVEFFYVSEKGGEYRPLTSPYASTWLCQRAEQSRIAEMKLFTRNPVYTDDWRLVSPGFDTPSGIYYAGPLIQPREGTFHLDRLLQDFCFKSEADRTNYLGMLLTAVLVTRFIGAKPAVLFNGNQPGLGKSILSQIIAILRDGYCAETASYNPNDEEFEKRLGAIVRRGATTIIIDNAKGHGRRTLIESACLERSITDRILSFRLLGKSDQIRAENSHIFCITANSPDVSPDLVSRSVVINLEYEGDPKRRTFNLADPENYAVEHRRELLGELIGMVERWKAGGRPEANVNSRFNKCGWGNVVGGILEFHGRTGFLTNAEAAAQLDETRREFEELVAILTDHEQADWTAAELVSLCSRNGLFVTDLANGTARSHATKLGTLAGRFIDETFDLPDDRRVMFQRTKHRKGNIYRVVVSEMPNLNTAAEPLPNVVDSSGSAS